MLSMPINSCKKRLLSYKDSTNTLNQVGFYAFDSYDYVMLANEFNSYIMVNPNSIIRIQEKFRKLIMILKLEPFSKHDKNKEDFDNVKESPKNSDLFSPDITSNSEIKLVHRRRDLDCLD